AAAGIESQRRQAVPEEPRVVPQPLHPLRLALEHVDGGNARRGHRRRMRGREQERARAMVEKFDELARAGDVSAQHADSLGERADLNIHAAMTIEVVDRAAPVPAEYAACMRIV